MGRLPASETITPMWMAHHYPEDYERCVVVGSRHVCRRCLFLYVPAFATLALAEAGVRWPGGLDPWLLWLLPLPGVVEFVVEHLAGGRYRPRLQAGLAVPMGVALGVGFDRYLHHPGDLLFWAVVVVYGGICLLAAIVGWRRGSM